MLSNYEGSASTIFMNREPNWCPFAQREVRSKVISRLDNNTQFTTISLIFHIQVHYVKYNLHKKPKDSLNIAFWHKHLQVFKLPKFCTLWITACHDIRGRRTQVAFKSSERQWKLTLMQKNLLCKNIRSIFLFKSFIYCYELKYYLV